MQSARPGSAACPSSRSTAVNFCAAPRPSARCRSPAGPRRRGGGRARRAKSFLRQSRLRQRAHQSRRRAPVLARADRQRAQSVCGAARQSRRCAAGDPRHRPQSVGNYYRWAHTNRHLVFFQERDGDENWRASSVDIASGAIVPLTPERGVQAYLQESDRKFPEEMLFRHNARDKRYFDLFRINIVTGKSEMLFENNEFAWCSPTAIFSCGSVIALRRRRQRRMSGAPRRRQLGAVHDGADRRYRHRPSCSTSAPTARRSTCSTRAAATRRRCSPSTWRPGTPPCSRPTTRPTSCMSTSTTSRRPLAARANQGSRPLACGRSRRGAGSGRSRQIRSRRRRGHRCAATTAVLRRRFTSATPRAANMCCSTGRREKCAACSGSARRWPACSLRKMQPVIIPARDGLRLNGYLTLPGAEAGSRQIADGAVDPRRPLCARRLGLQFHPSMAGQPRLCGAQRQLPRLDRIRQSLRQRGRQGMGRQDA